MSARPGSKTPMENPVDPAAIHLQAYLEFTVGDFAEAARLLSKAADLAPNDAAIQFDWALAASAIGHQPTAAAAFERAAELDPSFHDGLYNAAVCKTRLTDWPRAHALFHRAGAAAFGHWIRYGRQLLRRLFTGEFDRTFLTRSAWPIPTRDLPTIHDLLSIGYLQRGNIDQALYECRRALELEPTGMRHAALASVFQRAGNEAAARAAYAQALVVEPDLQDVPKALAALAMQGQDFVAARTAYEGFVRSDPNDVFSHARLLLLDTSEGKVDAASERFKAMVRSIVRRGVSQEYWEPLATIAYRAIMWPMADNAYRQITGEVSKQLAARALLRGGPIATTFSPPPRDQRLRVGYLSHNLRDHPIGHITANLFGAHDRTRYEIHVFYVFPEQFAGYTDKAMAGAEHFHQTIAKVSEVARLIREQNIDLLIYLDGYMSHRLMEVVALRPAPLQAFWMGHAGGYESTAIDYLIADPIVIPPEDDAKYGVKVIRLRDTFAPASYGEITPTPTRESAGFPKDGFIFCAFNNSEKIDRPILDSWMRILKAVDGSYLWLTSSNRIFQETMRDEAKAQGISGDRVRFASRLPSKAEHLARHRICGLYLDTITLNGATSALDALWAGVPVLTVHGDRFASRIATSFNKAIGLEDMTCASLPEYEARAIHLATHPDSLAEIHARLACNIPTYPLFQIDTFCRSLERGFDEIVAHASGVALAARPDAADTLDSRTPLGFSMTALLPDTPKIKIVHIGASHLVESPEAYETLIKRGYAHMIGFEPNVSEHARLVMMFGAGHTYLPYFIGKGGRATFYLTSSPFTCSLLKPNMALLERFQKLAEATVVRDTVTVMTRRLDDIQEVSDADYLKIDIQGAELDAFKVGKKILRSCLMLETEVEFAELYENQPLFGDIDRHLRRAGYMFHSLVNWCGRYFRPYMNDDEVFGALNQVLWGDAVYVRDFTKLHEMSADQLKKLAVMAHDLYGSADLALAILAELDSRAGQGDRLQATYLARVKAAQHWIEKWGKVPNLRLAPKPATPAHNQNG